MAKIRTNDRSFFSAHISDGNRGYGGAVEMAWHEPEPLPPGTARAVQALVERAEAAYAEG